MPNTNAADARLVCERLRAAVEALRVEAADGAVIAPTISIGLAQLRSGEKGSDLLARADAALYRAKRGGRNRVDSAEPQPATSAVERAAAALA